MNDLTVHYSSEKQDWETPQRLFDDLNAEFNFTLDAMASDTNHKVNTYFTQEQDALKQNWGDLILSLSTLPMNQKYKLKF